MSESAADEKLKEIFAEVLRLDRVNSDDIFLDLGGDSLSAILCISRIRAAFGVELFIEDFFSDDSTPKHLGSLIEKERQIT